MPAVPLTCHIQVNHHFIIPILKKDTAGVFPFVREHDIFQVKRHVSLTKFRLKKICPALVCLILMNRIVYVFSIISGHIHTFGVSNKYPLNRKSLRDYLNFQLTGQDDSFSNDSSDRLVRRNDFILACKKI